MNARHKNWYTYFNMAGTTLLRWANLHNWVIRGANLPNIDLLITKGLWVTETPEVAFGRWDGCSVHHPVCMATDHLLTQQRSYGKKISWAKRKSE